MSEHSNSEHEQEIELEDTSASASHVEIEIDNSDAEQQQQPEEQSDLQDDDYAVREEDQKPNSIQDVYAAARRRYSEEPKTIDAIFYVFLVIIALCMVVTAAGAIVLAFFNIYVKDSTPNAYYDVPLSAMLVSITSGLLALFVMVLLALKVLKSKVGISIPAGPRMYEISKDILDGSNAFLLQEFIYLAIFVFVVAIMLFLVDFGKTSACFLAGALTSSVTGFIGMSIATRANVRTTFAATTSLNSALRVAFNAGTVMGMSVVGLGILALSVMYLAFRNLVPLAGFGFGASSIALFARVGGGIFTKAADVGADLVGKVESNIPEDDPRNPAVIADNVGDNVGDVAGMGADLFESYVSSMIAAATIGGEHFGAAGVAAPFYIAAGGILCSIIGASLVSTNADEHAKDIQEKLLWAIRRGIFTAAALNTVLSLVILVFLFGVKIGLLIFFTFVIGLLAGIFIGVATEYSTSFSYRPTKSIAEAGRTGSATVIIKGLSVGMLSSVAPVFAIVIAIIGTVLLAEFAQKGAGIYGVAIAAVGMLSTLGVTLATDAYGPVADNAGGIAEMAELPEEVRDKTDALDALGNTTAASGKGFAIGSAVLTALALMNAFATASEITVINITDKMVISGLLVGACLPFIFASLTMTAVGDSAMEIIVEVRRQFNEIPGLLAGDPSVKPENAKCVAIATKSSLKKMVLPGLLAVAVPVVIGFLGRAKMLGGVLTGSIVAGFLLAVTMANAGGAWDNAKKYVEAGMMKDENGDPVQKGSEVHKAAVVGDTVGDPFKDTSGPALNILLKLMSIISLVIAPAILALENLNLFDKLPF